MNQRADGPIGKRIGAPPSGAHDRDLNTGPGGEQASGRGEMKCFNTAR